MQRVFRQHCEGELEGNLRDGVGTFGRHGAKPAHIQCLSHTELSMNYPKSHDQERAEAGLNPRPSVPIVILPPWK